MTKTGRFSDLARLLREGLKQVGCEIRIPYTSWVHPCAKELKMTVSTKREGDKLLVRRLS